jgi:hypothetical protein
MSRTIAPHFASSVRMNAANSATEAGKGSLPSSANLSTISGRRNGAACFGYNLKSAFNQPSLSPIRFEGMDRHPSQFSADQVDSLDNVDKADSSRR